MRLTSLLEIYRTERLEFGLALLLSYQPIVNGILMLSQSQRVFAIPYRLGALVRMGLLAIAAISVLSSFRILIKRLKFDVPIVTLTLILLFLIASLDPIKERILQEQRMIVFTFLECLPLYVICRAVVNWRALWRWLNSINTVVFAIYILAFLLVNVGSTHRYRTFASGVTPSSLIFMIEWAYLGNKLAAAPAAVSLFLVITCGRRSSAVLLLIAYGLICYYNKKYKYIAFGAFVALLMFLFGRQILTLAYYTVSSFGVRPRNLYRLLAGTASDDSGRFDRWIAILKEVNSSVRSQLIGMGLFSDRAILMKHLMFDTDRALYPHGIIVELIAHYGYPMGLAFAFWLFIVTPLRGAYRQKGRQSFICIFILYYSMSLALLFQGSYLQDKHFFMFLGMAVWLWQMKHSPDSGRDEPATWREMDRRISMPAHSAKLSAWRLTASHPSKNQYNHDQSPSN